MTLVSIVIPAHNATHFEEALKSALMQTSSSLGEIVVSDDSGGSEIRNVVNCLSKAASVPIEYFEYSQGRGESANFWNGISKSKHGLIKPLHDDDVLTPDAIDTLLELITLFPWVGFVAGSRTVINDKSEEIPVPQGKRIHLFNLSCDAYFKGNEVLNFLSNSPINFIGEPGCTLIRRDVLVELGDRFTRMDRLSIASGCGDLALWTNILRKYDLIMTPKQVCKHRVWGNSLSARYTNTKELRNLFLNGPNVIKERLSYMGYRQEKHFPYQTLNQLLNDEYI